METTLLKTFDNYFSANIILGRLQDAGINCFLKDEMSATIYPALNNAIGGIKLMVFENDAEDALELLTHFEEEYLRTLSCPQCREKDIEMLTEIIKASLIENFLSWLFRSSNISAVDVYRCSNCGWESKTLSEAVLID
jgi:Zn ribbon nucleic-acid-binding protein